MIFVSVGTHKQQFDRLLKEIDGLIENKKIKGTVFAQIGSSYYTPKNFKYKKFLSLEEFDKNVKKCGIFITHAGEGNIGTGLQYEKRMIVVPRLKKFGEHTNDHQLELADAMRKENRAIVCGPEGIERALVEIKKLKPKKTAHAGKIILLLKKFESKNFSD
ncbi:MAG: PssE/Cps14G family polysaccharide biosynthesis glycosyltransferase [archaeon]|jgi:UDP-N-acetylglucosamine transferase subunit ALG13